MHGFPENSNFGGSRLSRVMLVIKIFLKKHALFHFILFLVLSLSQGHAFFVVTPLKARPQLITFSLQITLLKTTDTLHQPIKATMPPSPAADGQLQLGTTPEENVADLKLPSS